MHALVTVADLLAVSNWQRSKDGQSGKNRPKPTPRPSLTATKSDKAAKVADRARAFRERQAQQQTGGD